MLEQSTLSMFVKLGYWEAYRVAVVVTASCFRYLLYLLGFLAVLYWVVLPVLLLFRPFSQGWVSLAHNVRPFSWFLGLMVVFVFVLPLLSARKVVTDKRLKGGVTYQISNAGIYIENPVAKTDLSWSAIQHISELRSDFLLFISRSNALALPKRCFSSTDEVAAARELFRIHVPAARLRSE